MAAACLQLVIVANKLKEYIMRRLQIVRERIAWGLVVFS